MSEFVASNGGAVELEDGGWVKVDGPGFFEYIDRRGVEALREFFQHERDEELGRWRWPDDSNIVVVPSDGTYINDGKRWVNVYDERKMGQSSWYCSEDSAIGCRGSQPLHDAAHDYFKLHPKPKPWEDAAPGEVWVVKWLNSNHPVEAVVVPGTGWDANWAVDSAHRIWPES